MDYLFLHRDKRTFTSERQKNLLFRAARLYWEQKYEGREPEKARKVDCELYKYVLYYLEVRAAVITPQHRSYRVPQGSPQVFGGP